MGKNFWYLKVLKREYISLTDIYCFLFSLAALVMALAADKSAAEGRWVKFQEIVQSVACSSPADCMVMDDEIFPEGFRVVDNVEDLLVPDVDQVKSEEGWVDRLKKVFA